MKFFHRLDKKPGLSQVDDEACTLLKFSKLDLPSGGSYEGSLSDDREAVLVILAGRASVKVGDTTFENIGQRTDVFSGNPHSVYLPRACSYRVEALTDLEAAFPSAPSLIDIDPYEIRSDEVGTGTWGALNFTRHYRKILVDGDGRPASTILVGETITPSGNWSTYPPHKHESNSGGEVFHEEMYYFRNQSPGGYGLAQHYSPERGYDEVYRVKGEEVLSMPHGYHTFVAAPGSASYYLWFLAGDGRGQGTSFDPELGWVQKTVGLF